MRPTFQHIYMNFAFEIAKRSTCRKTAVGCVITSKDFAYVYGIGYNGNAKGRVNDCDFITYRGDGCGCIHAEINALIKCHVTDRDKVMFVTMMPCPDCAKAMINAGFSAVYYKDLWGDGTGIRLLTEAGIKVKQL